MFKLFKRKRNWKQEQAEIDRLTEIMFQQNAEMTKMYWSERNRSSNDNIQATRV